MEKIIILGALNEEIEYLLHDLKDKKEKQWNFFTIHEGILFGKNVVICQTQIGKVYAAMATQHLIDTYNPTKVIFTGVAGGVHTDVNVGDVIVSTDLVQHDFDTTAFGDPKGHIPRVNKRFFEADTELIKKALDTEFKDYNIYEGRIATGDQFITDISPLEEFNAYCVDMEGAAVAQVCDANKIPFLIIRIISDKADNSAKGDFEKNLPIFAANSKKVIEKLLK
ncbi:5'-methylthioadenosine/adenosylhomocysteine nucleosidase [Candidatus Woesearchaeota archaeon]|nr:5'-methylthioadenosine/adenosylhomocysteine nucleosidase [Candidatus Woesearchaeota archaeon]